MKIECLRTMVDPAKIKEAIYCFKAEHRKNPSYVVMNYKTCAALKDTYCRVVYPSFVENGIKEEIFSIPVAYNDGLKFGEVDIV